MRSASGVAGSRAAVAWLALCVAFILAYLPTVVSLAAYFSANDMYSYGFLVPFIRRKKQSGRKRGEPSR